MGIKDVLNCLDIMPGKTQIDIVKKESKLMVMLLKNGLREKKIKAEVFIGGSFPKGTLVKSEDYDIDIFVRFDNKYENISLILKSLTEKLAKSQKLEAESIHGSRDYIRLQKGEIIFEIVPVIKIKKPSEAQNITDLSYFHVNYVKKKLKRNLAKEVVLAKQFCKAQKVYGAESYVSGFSGYALECLIIYYKSFEKMLKALANAKEKVIIDPEKLYKNKDEIVISLNESKLKSPIVLVDPTWKERNVLAALNNETFLKFQESARRFLKHPDRDFFAIRKFDIKSFQERAKKDNAEFVKISIETDRQAGDIAGTKLKKFASYIEKELARFFEIKEKEFDYAGKDKATIYIAAKSRGEITRTGPPIKLKAHVAAFRKQNKKNKVFEKNGILHAKIKVKGTAKSFLDQFAKKFSKTIKSMGVVEMKIF